MPTTSPHRAGLEADIIIGLMVATGPDTPPVVKSPGAVGARVAFTVLDWRDCPPAWCVTWITAVVPETSTGTWKLTWPAEVKYNGAAFPLTDMDAPPQV